MLKQDKLGKSVHVSPQGILKYTNAWNIRKALNNSVQKMAESRAEQVKTLEVSKHSLKNDCFMLTNDPTPDRFANPYFDRPVKEETTVDFKALMTRLKT